MFSLLISHPVKPEVERHRLAHIEAPPPFAIHLALDCALGLEALVNARQDLPPRCFQLARRELSGGATACTEK